jgi:hypothetical protein
MDWRANAAIAPSGVLALTGYPDCVDYLDVVYDATDGKFDIIGLANVRPPQGVVFIQTVNGSGSAPSISSPGGIDRILIAHVLGTTAPTASGLTFTLAAGGGGSYSNSVYWARVPSAISSLTVNDAYAVTELANVAVSGSPVEAHIDNSASANTSVTTLNPGSMVIEQTRTNSASAIGGTFTQLFDDTPGTAGAAGYFVQSTPGAVTTDFTAPHDYILAVAITARS